ncbi:hypothetical protein [Desulfovibrio sp. TomC]|nr:hypothetical protein [Desulfovibrio sp. TomC]KHK01741.1 hypothetical protein NY78_2829 [Desulfovibrio sp. TomC]
MEVEREDAYWERYSRNILLPEIGVDGHVVLGTHHVSGNTYCLRIRK